MKKLVGFLLLLSVSIGSIEAKNYDSRVEFISERSCVSIAAEVSDGNRDLFAAAYKACILSRCDCFNEQ